MADPAFLAGVKWEQAADASAPSGDIPHVTHSGVLEVMGHSLRCYRLSDGRTIFDADDFGAFMREWFDGAAREGVE